MKEKSLAERTRQLISNDRMDIIREYSDDNLVGCAHTAIYEIKKYFGVDKLPRLQRFKDIIGDGQVPFIDFFKLLRNELGEEIKIKAIHSSKGAFEGVELGIYIELVKEHKPGDNVEYDYPALILFANPNDQTPSHIIAETGNEKVDEVKDLYLSAGRQVVFVITFNKIQ